MLKIRFIRYAFLLSLLLPAAALSQPQEMKDYTVREGDTLWDISGRELNDPFLWPKVWKENPDIKNPDRLYPGQIVKIPLYLIQKEKPEEAAPEPAVSRMPEPVKVPEMKKPEPVMVKMQPLLDKSLLTASGYISATVGGLGNIAGSASGRSLFGNNDIVFVNTSMPVKTGDRFYIIRADRMVYHPVTGKSVGYLVEIRGIAEISQFELGQTKAVIRQSFGDIRTGDTLDTYYEMNPPLTTGTFRKPDISGMIISTKNLQMLNSNFDVVYIDKGRNDGIDIGDMLRAVRVEKFKVPIGVIQVINALENSATAIVRDSSEPLMPGHIIIRLE